jgi:hypothetical protein
MAEGRVSIPVRVYCTHVYPDGKGCLAPWDEHVHILGHCANGALERHHEYAPPRSVTLDMDGQTYRVRLRPIEPSQDTAVVTIE